MSDTQTPSPRTLLSTGITTSSPPTIHQALDLYRAHPRGLNPQTQLWAVGFAIKDLQRVSLQVLIKEFGREILEKVGPAVVGAGWARGLQELDGGEGGRGRGLVGVEEVEGRFKDVVEVLMDAGWDLNCGEGGPTLDGGFLIYDMADSFNLVKWCLDHGAHVTYPDSDSAPTPPLLETVAKRGTVETFKLLREQGAPLGKRILHRAAEQAAYADTPEKLALRMKMVKFLVEEVGLDVNGIDEGGRPNFYGTPINYAAHANGGKEVVEYLLQKGADPRIKDRWGICDAFTFARQGNPGVLKILTDWKEEQDSDEK